MYLLYMDESGPPDRDHFVVASFAVHEQDAAPMAFALDELADQLPDRVRGAEFHAGPIRRGSDGWRALQRSARRELEAELASLLTRGLPASARAPVLFAVVLHRESFPHQDPNERTYEEFFARPNGFLGRLASAGDPHRCVVIADKSSPAATIQRLMGTWRTSGASTGAAIGRMAAYAEVPLFVDSRASRLVQLADFVAHWVYRAYEHGDTSVLDRLLPAFDSEGDAIHGLVHLVHDYRSCDCPACGSRRG